MNKKLSISVIIPNYNGRDLLQDCLESIFKSDYPKTSLQVILVDNDSEDNSVAYVRKNWPQVLVIRNEKNEGFTGAVNKGYEYASGDFISLINTDVRVDSSFFSESIQGFKSAKTGIVCPKVYYATPYILLNIYAQGVSRSDLTFTNEFDPMGIIMEEPYGNNKNLSEEVFYLRGFYEKQKSNVTSYWTKPHAELLVPFRADKVKETYNVNLHGPPLDSKFDVPIKISHEKNILFKGSISSKEVEKVSLTLERSKVKKSFIWLIQNAGNVLFTNARSRDRGSVVSKSNTKMQGGIEFYDFDCNYYSKQTKLLSMNGAACLISRKMIEDIGFLEEHFFMYYEDVEFSLRAWRRGWDIYYQPSAVAYHMHRTTTGKKMTSFLLHMIEKNHLMISYLYFPTKQFLMQFVFFLIKYLVNNLQFAFFTFMRYFGNHYKASVVKKEARRDTLKSLFKLRKYLTHRKKALKENEVRTFKDMSLYLY